MTMATLVFAAALAAPRPPTVAVSYFDNNTGQAEMAPLAKGLADMLITDLAAVPGIQIVEREKLNQALAELQLSRSRFIDPATAQKLGRGLAAQEYCESEVLERIGRLRSWGLKSARGYWANTRKEAAKLPRSDWRRVRMDNDPAIKAMLALYARAADGAAATTPPAEAAKTPR